MSTSASGFHSDDMTKNLSIWGNSVSIRDVKKQNKCHQPFISFSLTTFSKDRLIMDWRGWGVGRGRVEPEPGDCGKMLCSLGIKCELRDQPVQITIPTIYGLFTVCQALC